MGVQNLWQLVQPVGRPVTLESLEGKILAVDVSIWLNQAIKGMRDGRGSTVHNAHIVSLFHRVCKLLFYKIKPVFVFDGGVPELKRQTLAARRNMKQSAEDKMSRIAQNILSNRVQEHAVQAVLGSDAPGTSKTTSKKATTTFDDMFVLPPVGNHADGDEEDSAVIEPWEERLAARRAIEDRYQNIDDVNINSEEFSELPAEIRHEILVELKERNKHRYRIDTESVPEESLEFSNFQVANLLQRSKLTQHIEGIRKEMKSRPSADIDLVTQLGGDAIPIQAESRTLASQESTHYVLLTGLKHASFEKGEAVQSSISKDNNKTQGDVSTNSNVDVESKETNAIIHSQSSSVIDLTEEANHEEVMEKSDNAVDEKYSSAGVFVLEDDIVVAVDDRKAPEQHLVPSERNAETSETTEKIICNRGEDKKLNVEQRVMKDEATNKDAAVHKEKRCSEDSGGSPSKKSASVLRDQINKEEKPDTTVVRQNPGDLEIEQKPSITIQINPDRIPAASDDLFPASLFEDLKGIGNLEKSQYPVINVPPAAAAADDDDDAMVREPDSLQLDSHNDLTTEELVDIQRVLEADAAELRKKKEQQERMATTVNDYMYADAQELLQLFGIPYVVAPMEAEAQCAFLDGADLCNGVITDDSDVWLFGGRRVYKNFFNQDKTVEKFQNDDIATELGLCRGKLINLAMLVGSDYTPGVHGVGVILAMELLGEFPGDSIESLREMKKWWDLSQQQEKFPEVTKIKSRLRKLDIPPTFPSQVVADGYLHPVVDNSLEPFSWSTPDLCSLREYAKEKLRWTRDKVDSILLPVMKKVAERSAQTSMDRYLVQFPAEKRTVGSKRLQSAIKKSQNLSPDEPVEKNAVAKEKQARR